MELNNENYFSTENQMQYMGASQFGAFLKCEAAALADLDGTYPRKVTDALLVGSYVDAYYEGTLDKFKAEHPEILTQKGELKAQYKHADEIIQRAERDEMFKKYMSGEKQVIFTGKIAGIPYKIKVDSYHPDKCIVDLKCVKDFDSVWDGKNKTRKNFIEHWGYLRQAAIYQEIVRQNTGKVLPFYIAAITKEPEPNIEIIYIPDEYLVDALKQVEEFSPRFNMIKHGEIKPERCGGCDYCKFTKVLKEPFNYADMTTAEAFEDV